MERLVFMLITVTLGLSLVGCASLYEYDLKKPYMQQTIKIPSSFVTTYKKTTASTRPYPVYMNLPDFETSYYRKKAHDAVEKEALRLIKEFDDSYSVTTSYLSLSNESFMNLLNIELRKKARIVSLRGESTSASEVARPTKTVTRIKATDEDTFLATINYSLGFYNKGYNRGGYFYTKVGTEASVELNIEILRKVIGNKIQLVMSVINITNTPAKMPALSTPGRLIPQDIYAKDLDVKKLMNELAKIQLNPNNLPTVRNVYQLELDKHVERFSTLFERVALEEKEQLKKFTQSISTGDETNCGLVIDINRTLVNIQNKFNKTKWIESSNLFPDYAGRTCEEVF